MLDLFCLLLIQFNQSIKQVKERKKVQQTNQPTIYFIVICSFFSIQFNSIQFKKRKEMIETNDQEDNHKASKLSHSSNKSHQSINQSSKWKSDEMRFVKLFISNKSIFKVSQFQFRNKTKSQFNQSINEIERKSDFDLVLFVSNLVLIFILNLISFQFPINQSSQRDEREKWIEREKERNESTTKFAFCTHQSINQSIKSSEMKWINFHSFILFIWSESDFNDDDDVQLIWEWIN